MKHLVVHFVMAIVLALMSSSDAEARTVLVFNAQGQCIGTQVVVDDPYFRPAIVVQQQDIIVRDVPRALNGNVLVVEQRGRRVVVRGR